MAEARHALVVASTTYTDLAFAQLRSPAQDATDMIGVLAAPDLGGFAVTPVLDRPEYEIRRAIDAFVTARRVDDLVLIYLSCHGVLDARGRLYFAATDTVKTQLSSTAIESRWLMERLDDCSARRQVLILDCCFSGAFAHLKGDTEVELERRFGRGRAVLTASRASEYSYEGAPLGTGATPSVFTAALVDGIRNGGADQDNDGLISVDDAYTYAAERVRAAGGVQRPQRWLYGGEGQIILARNPRGAASNTTGASEAQNRHTEKRLRQYLADASHGLRIPLTTIRGFAELYRQGAVSHPDDTARLLRRIEDEARRMGLVVEDLLLLARLDAQPPLAADPVNVAVLASDAMTDAHSVAPNRSVSLVLPSGGGPYMVTGDESRLRQMIQNLMTNALTHTPADASVTVRVARATDWVTLEVTDTGPGLDDQQQQQVFERFYRLDRPHIQRHGPPGAGLGLSIVAAIVAAHSGTVEVDSAPGHGATFRVRLPAAPNATDRTEPAGSTVA